MFTTDALKCVKYDQALIGQIPKRVNLSTQVQYQSADSDGHMPFMEFIN